MNDMNDASPSPDDTQETPTSIPSGAIDLTQYDEAFAEADVVELEPVPDGHYPVVVEGVELRRARTSGNPFLNWTLRIESPSKHAGRLLWRINGFGSPDQLRWLKTDLSLCGLQLERLSDLPNRFDDLIGIRLDVTKRTRDEDNVSVYFNRRLDSGPTPFDTASPTTDPAATRDDLPF